MTLLTTVVSARTVEIQTDPLAPPLLVTRAALITASKADTLPVGGEDRG